jgi:hypothetical protein
MYALCACPAPRANQSIWLGSTRNLCYLEAAPVAGGHQHINGDSFCRLCQPRSAVRRLGGALLEPAPLTAYDGIETFSRDQKVIASQVQEGSPADAAGVRRDDVEKNRAGDELVFDDRDQPHSAGAPSADEHVHRVRPFH